MKNVVVGLVVASSVFMVGCSKTDDEIAFERQKELIHLQQSHEREMARIEADKIEAANQVSHTYIENEYEYDQEPQQNYTSTNVSSGYAEPSYQQTAGYTDPAYQYQQQPVAEDSGVGVGGVLVAGAVGLAAGYMVGEMLDNGMRSYTDEKGVRHYTDKDGRPVTKEQYEQKKKTSKVTQFKEKASVLAGKTKQAATNAATSVKNGAVTAKDKVKTEIEKRKATEAQKKGDIAKQNAVEAERKKKIEAAKLREKIRKAKEERQQRANRNSNGGGFQSLNNTNQQRQQVQNRSSSRPSASRSTSSRRR